MFIRSLKKNWKGNVVSLTGLSIGMMVAILSVSYIIFETSYDTFHSKSERLYTVYTEISVRNNDLAINYATYSGMKDYALKYVPLVESACRLKETNITTTLKCDNTVYKNLTGYYAEPEFFKMFDFKMLLGDPGSLSEPGKIIITASLSKKLFGNSKSIDRIVQINDSYFTVSGIVKDPPLNSNFAFNFLVPYMENSAAGQPFSGDEEVSLYLLTTSVQKKNDLLKESLDKYFIASGKEREKSLVIALKDLHQYSQKTQRNFLIFITISLLVLFTSVVNYINIYQAAVEVRVKEIGMRKVFGASRGTIIRMIITESVIITTMASVIGLILSELLLGLFQKLTSVEVQQYGPGLWKIQAAIVTLALLLGIVAGFLTSLKYSDYKPVDLVEGIIRTGYKNYFRKLFIGLQFVISGGLMVLMVIFSLQLSFLRNADMGFETSNRVLISLSAELKSKYNMIHNEIINIPGVEIVTGRSGIFGNADIAMVILNEKTVPKSHILTFGFNVEDDFFRTYGIKMIEGNDFSDISGRDPNLAVIDKFSADQLGFEHPVGEKFRAAGRTLEIIGVVEDADFLALNQQKEPRIYVQFNEDCSEITIRHSGDEKVILEKIVKLLTGIDPNYVVEYRRLDDAVKELYKKENNLLKIISICGLIAIALSLTGAYAMVSYLSERRLRQNSIRRIFGASERNITMQSIFEIGWPVVLGILLSWPGVYIISRNWLTSFAVKISIGPLPFIISLAGISLLVVITVYTISRRSALRNPADLLRQE